MDTNKIMRILKITTLALFIILFGCSSPLLETIKEDVEVIKTPPSITTVYPNANATSISIEDEIQIVFTKSIQTSSVTNGTFIIEDEYGERSTGSYTISSDTVTFSPNKLYYNTEYTVNATSGILDADGNSFSDGYVWTFTTQAAPASIKPLLNGFQINNGISATSNTDIELSFLAADSLGGTTGLTVHYKSTDDDDWSNWISMDSGFASVSEILEATVADGENKLFSFEAEVMDSNKVVSPLKTAEILFKTTKPTVDNSLSYPSKDSNDSPGNLTTVEIAFDTEMDPSTVNSNSIYISKGISRITTHEFDFDESRTILRFSYFELASNPYTFEEHTMYTVFIGGTVSDIAGISFEDDEYYTFTTGSYIDTTAPMGSIVLNLDDPYFNATNSTDLNLMIQAEDDITLVRSVQLWGDSSNSGTFPYSEYDNAIYSYSENNTTGNGIPYMSLPGTISPWTIPNSEGEYNIYYKFEDFAGNWSTRQRVIVQYDNSLPQINGIQINDNSGFVSNSDGKVDLLIDAEDAYSGLKRMWIEVSNSAALPTPPGDTTTWPIWSPINPEYDLSSSNEGEYYFHITVEDFVGNTPLSLSSESIILDYTEPEIDFTGIDIINTNSLTQQNILITDPDPGAAAYEIPSGIDSYLWEQFSGPVDNALTFFSDDSGTVDPTVPEPFISSSETDGSEDGSYKIQITVTDNAGNTSSDIRDFIWDTTDPGDIGVLSVFNDSGNQITTSDNGSMVFTSSAQPYVTWDPISETDFYTSIPYNSTLNPNADPGIQYDELDRDNGWYPHWDDDQVNWDTPSTYEDKNYIKVENPLVSAPAPENPGDNDGPVFFYVAAWDNAGNRSNRDPNNKYVKFHIDTLKPIIKDVQILDPTNSSYTIDFKNTSGGDGLVYDQRTLQDPDNGNPGTDGSGIDTYLWEQNAGSGTLTILNDDLISPTISASTADDEYQLKLTVTDYAGNIQEGYINLIWDTTPPNSPNLTGIPRTPSLTPLWTWSSNGGGNGTFQYRLERIARNSAGTYSGSPSEVVAWTETTSLSYTSGLSNGYEYTLQARERDDAGNWSGISSTPIWIDDTFTSEPAITRTGDYLRNATNTSVTWNWTTGLGNPTTERYRWRIDSGSWSVLSIGDSNHNIVFSSSPGTDDGIHTFEVEEYNTSYTYPDPDGWVTKVGSSTVRIDATPPEKPSFTTQPGIVPPTYNPYNSPTDSTYRLTTDNTPTWVWTYGTGDGIRSYRYSYNEVDWFETGSTVYTPSLQENTYILYVQERDEAGNWSASATSKLEIDDTAPTLSSITLSHRASGNTSYTTENYVRIDINGIGSDSNIQTFTGSDILYMRFWNSGGTKYSYYHNPSNDYQSTWAFSTGGTNTLDGSRTVYCELVDYAGNVSVQRYDSISKDTVKPTVNSFYINNNSTTTTSSSVNLDSSYSGADRMRFSVDNGLSWSSWYNDYVDYAYTLETGHGYLGHGAKKIIAQFTDWAGYYTRNAGTGQASHYTQVQDSIFFGSPTVRYAHKGRYNDGRIYFYYEDFEDYGDSTTTYYIYYSYTPTGTKYLRGTTTNSSYFYDNDYTKGQLYYFHVRANNPDIGLSGYSSSTLGFTSDVTVVYDDTDSADTSLASRIKSRLTNHYENNYTQVLGTFPQYTVTLLPEDLIDNTYTAGETIIYGDPTILTPGTGSTSGNSSGWYSTIQNRAHNIAAGNKGILGMHYQGSRYMHYANYYISNSVWTDSGLSTTAPGDLVYSKASNKGTTLYGKTAIYNYIYDYAWYYGAVYSGYGIYYDNYWDNYRYSQTSARIFTNATEKYSIYNTSPSNTNYTRYHIYDNEYTDYYTGLRQGRFMFWGYKDVPTYSYFTSYPIFINMVGILHRTY